MESCSKRPDETKNISLSNEEDINKKAKKKKVNSKNYGGSFKYKVPFKSEWKVNFSVKKVYNDKYKFHCLPCGKNLLCYHQGLGDVQVHCSGRARINKQLYHFRIIKIFLSKIKLLEPK